MFGKYSVYIFLSYAAAALIFLGLIVRAKWRLKEAQQLCKAQVNEQKHASNS